MQYFPNLVILLGATIESQKKQLSVILNPSHRRSTFRQIDCHRPFLNVTP